MEEFLESVRLVSRELERYWFESISGSTCVVNQVPMRAIIDELNLKAHLETGGLTGDALAKFVGRYLSLSVRLHHPGSLAHQVAVPHPAAALATLIEGFTNNPMGIYEMGPAAASIEAFVIEWLLSKVGWTSVPCNVADQPDVSGAGGVLTHGGSLANLAALVAARSRFDNSVWARGCDGDLAVMATAGCHYSIARAAGILGIGAENLYTLPDVSSDLEFNDQFETAMQRVRLAGKRPFAFVANACSTATGAFDPLEGIARICRAHGLWLHVDGAHGASALLSRKHRHRLNGVESADSLTWDAHKLMRTPGLCTALLVRNARTLDAAFHQDASYLFHAKAQPGFDSLHRTVECTKASLGFRLFLVLAAMGEKALADYIDRQFDLTQEAYKLFCSIPGLECPVAPQSNILCFRVVEGDDQMQLSIRDRLLAEGEFHLSTAVVGDRRYLRLVVTSPSTERADLQRLARRVLQMVNRHTDAGSRHAPERDSFDES